VLCVVGVLLLGVLVGVFDVAGGGVAGAVDVADAVAAGVAVCVVGCV